MLAALAIACLPLLATAAPKAEPWPLWNARDARSTERVDHTAWTAFLNRYLDTAQSPHRLAYAQVNAADRERLDGYLAALQARDPRTLNRGEQMAYWINLYNAATVALVLDHYPIASITKIRSGWFRFGPWDITLLRVAGQDLTLNDIEHRILRPLYDDPRTHYAVNCASLGCPDLAAEAYQGEFLDAQLDQAARAYVNHPRGVHIDDDELLISRIYDWFATDFGGGDTAVIGHLIQHADRELKAALMRFDSIDGYRYDWSLNDQR